MFNDDLHRDGHALLAAGPDAQPPSRRHVRTGDWTHTVAPRRAAAAASPRTYFKGWRPKASRIRSAPCASGPPR